MEFSDIALAKLLTTQPELGSLIVTFEDVSDQLNDDSGIQVGVFVLQSGGSTFYIPVVSKADNVYPIDSVFFDDRKKFFPLTKKTVNMITASSQLEQGKAVKTPKTVTQNPSVYGIITPPRTGKYSYASTSRLVDFLAGLPDHLKQFTFEKFAAEKSMYDELDKMYSLRAIFDVLTPKSVDAPSVTPEPQISIVTGASPRIKDEAIANIVEHGYHIQGTSPSTRVAISVQDFNQGGVAREISEIDGDRDYEIAFAHGPSREAFIPKLHKYSNVKNLAIFTNGDYATAKSFVAVGDTPDRKEVLKRLFEYSPPVLLRDLGVGDKFVITTNSGLFLGPFEASKVILNSNGVEVRVSYSGNIDSICGYRNFMGEAELDHGTLYIPSNTIVIPLGQDVTFELDRSVNSAAKRRQFETLKMLGDELNLGYDGVEFIVNGKTAGLEVDVMKRLVITEGIDPEQAMSFVKQAQQTKFTKIYLTKRAESSDYSPAEIPSYGQVPTDSPDLKPNGAYNPNLVGGVQKSLPLQDGQVTESVIISELLQCPDMFEQITEYLPDIEEAVDKLGRILFMSRIHINKLGETTDTESVFAFLAQLKAVYRMLGDNLIKLQELVSSSKTLVEHKDED